MSENTIVVEARCRVCGRRLTDPDSVKNEIGPVCAEKLKRPGYFQALSPSKDGYAIDEDVGVSMLRVHCDSCGKESYYVGAYFCPYCGAPMKARTLEVVLA